VTYLQRDALLTLAFALERCQAYGITLEHDLCHMRLEVEGCEPLEAGYIGAEQIQEYLRQGETK
jgi:hypothetical protein